MSTAERHSLNRLPAELEWHEAVAIVQEIATRALAGETGIVRHAADIALDSDGHVILPATAPVVPVFGNLKMARQAQDLSDLRTLLHELLPKTTLPPTLAVLADPANANAGLTSVADLSKALAFFERPNRARDLKIVAARLAATTEQLTLQERLADLTRKARSDDRRETAWADQPAAAEAAPEPAHETLAATVSPPPIPEGIELQPGADFFSEAELAKPQPVQRRPDRKPRLDVKIDIKKEIQNWLPDARTLALVAGILCLFAVVVIGGYAGYTLVTRATAEADGAAATAPTASAEPPRGLLVEKTSGSAPRSKPRATNGGAPPAASTATRRGAVAIEAEKRNSPSSAASAVTTHTSNPQAPAATIAASSSTFGQIPPVPPLFGTGGSAKLGGQPVFVPNRLLDSAASSWDAVYDVRDSRVLPAKLLRPQLPEIPPNTSIETLGVFEFIVSMRGTVERIRLVRSPAERQYRDIMLMPAAKAWIFQPATKDGLPVRYRLQIPIPQ